jgi:hypothetical protein
MTANDNRGLKATATVEISLREKNGTDGQVVVLTFSVIAGCETNSSALP